MSLYFDFSCFTWDQPVKAARSTAVLKQKSGVIGLQRCDRPKDLCDRLRVFLTLLFCSWYWVCLILLPSLTSLPMFTLHWVLLCKFCSLVVSSKLLWNQYRPLLTDFFEWLIGQGDVCLVSSSFKDNFIVAGRFQLSISDTVNAFRELWGFSLPVLDLAGCFTRSLHIYYFQL